MSPGYARRTILLVAAAFGLITATLGYVYVSKSRQGAGNVTQAVVAIDYIPARTVIAPNMVQLEGIPASDVKPDTALTLPQVRDRVTMAPVEKGEAVSLINIIDKSAVFGLAAIIPPGKRAMGITVDATDVMPGLLQPGERVDVVASFVSGSDSVAKTIIQNVSLLAVNGNMMPVTQQAGPQDQTTKGATSSTQPTATLVTIAVTPSEAERLVAAQHKGKLRLGIRGMSDNSRVVTTGANTSMIMGAASGVVTTTTVPRPAPRRRYRAQPAFSAVLPPMPVSGLGPALATKTVRVIKGTEVQDVPVDE